MAYKRNTSRPNATGRNPTTRFVRLDYAIVNSNAYRSLTCNARALLVELVMLSNGSNNGSIYLGVRDAAHRIGLADTTAARNALDELTDTGFITMTQDGHFRIKASETSRARCWRLNWLHGPGRRMPSIDFLTHEPAPHTKAYRRMDRGNRVLKAYRRARDSGRLPVLESDTLEQFRQEKAPFAVSHSYTLNRANGGFLPKCHVPDFATHIATPWGEGATGHGTDWSAFRPTPIPARMTFTAEYGAIHRSIAA